MLDMSAHLFIILGAADYAAVSQVPFIDLEPRGIPMKKIVVVVLTVILGAFGFVACDKKNGSESHEEGEHAVVESGTYKGTIAEVNADEKEIYVDSDGKELELYFIDKTELTRGGKNVGFSSLKKGQKIEVKVKKVGKRLDPLSVKILE